MMITLQNYEEYFVRYIDNDLSKEELAEVQLFLQQHPELKVDLDAFQATVLQPDDAFSFPGKQTLKRSIHAGNYEEYFARFAEEDLSSTEADEVQHFLKQNHSLKMQLDAYKASKLEADLTIVYPDKNSLKKKEPGKVVPLYARYILSAAVAAGLLLLFFVKGIQWTPGKGVVPVAQTESGQPEIDADGQVNPVTEFPSNNLVVSTDSPDSSAFSPAVSNQNLPKVKNKKNNSKVLKDNVNSLAMYAVNIEPMNVDLPDQLRNYRRVTRAPFLVPVYENENPDQNAGNNGNKAVGSWLSVASVVGTEILKLSGRGDLVKSADAEEQHKTKEALSLSIQTKKFSFYHKFLNKKHSSTSK
ncbi:MAG: hypothetical protein ABIO46_09090 [Chitinophagales bacterium]